MNPTSGSRPFPIPVVAFGPLGPGSQEEDEVLDYITLPSGMDTYRAPPLPEPEELAGHSGALGVLHAVLGTLQAHLRGEAVAPVKLEGLNDADRTLINQVLGEGEVSAQVLTQPELRSFDRSDVRVRVQESVFAGVWRVMEMDDDGIEHDHIEVGDIPAALRLAAAHDAVLPRAALAPVPSHIINVPTILTELADQRERWQPGDAAHVVNLTLLPLTPEDIGHIDHQLGTGRVLILSRGYGNCRITNTCVAHTWRVVYYNSSDSVILNSIEVSGLPEVACAAHEDLVDSAERLSEVLQWVAQA
jgi:hydrogenase-1 operon protein HyaF